MLRVLAMLASNVISTFQMNPGRTPVIGARAMPASLPGEKSAPSRKQMLSPRDGPTALMLRSAARQRVLKHGGVLTIVSQEPHGSGPPVRGPRERGDPVLLNR